MKKSDHEIRNKVNDWYTINSITPKYHIKENIKHSHTVRVKIIYLLLEKVKIYPALNRKMQIIIEMIITEESRSDVKKLIKSLIGDIRVLVNRKNF